MNRDKLEHILAYAKQQKEMGLMRCQILPADMVEIVELALASNSPVLPDGSVPEGYALVPIEPTEAMMLVLGMTGSFDSMIAKYQKMLAAAPQHKGE